MLDEKDYAKLTLAELLKEEKEIKKKETLDAVLVGVLIGVMFYGVVKNGFGFIYIAIPLFLMSGIYKNSQNRKQRLKQVQTEIKEKTQNS